MNDEELKESRLIDWLESGLYMPRFMRDFHDQKDLFKSIGSLSDCSISPTSAHIYVVDKFLWYMASRGYTLQKSRKNIEFKPFVEWRETDQYKALASEIFSGAVSVLRGE